MDRRPMQTNKQSQLQWEILPLEITHMILGHLEWPSHWACKQVCRAWRVYLDEPRMMRKRYFAPKADRVVTHRVKNADGTVEWRYIQPKPVTNEQQIHRILGEPGIGFVLSEKHLSPEIKAQWLDGYYYMFQDRLRSHETDLDGFFSEAKFGDLSRREYPADLCEIDIDYNEEISIPECDFQPFGGYCLHMTDIPFRDEIAIKPPSSKWRLKVINGRDGTYWERPISFLSDAFKHSTGPVTVGELVKAIKEDCNDVLAEHLFGVYWAREYPNGPHLFVRIEGIYNLPDHDYKHDDLLVEVTVFDYCKWEERGTSATSAPETQIDDKSGDV